MEILKTIGLSKIYLGKVNFTALKEIDFTLEKGEFVAIMGPSGSGKSTFLNCISTIDKPTKGEVFINEKNPYSLSDNELASFRRRELGFVFQNFNLISTLTVEENILVPLVLESTKFNLMKKKVKDISSFLNIEQLLKKRTFEISGGQAQRVAIARALIHNPSLILADEPTGNLDSKSAKDVMKLFLQINQTMKSSILMVTHDAYVASFCSRVIFIKDGELFHEIHKGVSQSEFYQKIVEMLSFLGGEQIDFDNISR